MIVWPSLLAQAAESRVRDFAWWQPISPWVLFLVVVPALVGFAVFFYRREGIPRTVPSFLRWILASVRVAVLLSIVAILCEPVIRTTTYKTVDSTVLVLVDDSLSMDIKDKYSDRALVDGMASFLRSTSETVEATTRYDLVRRVFRASELRILDKIREKSRVVVFTIALGLRRVGEFPKISPGESSPEGGDVLPAYEQVRAEERVQETRLGDALLDAVAAERGGVSSASGSRLAGIVLFSDGQQTPGARPLDDVARRLGQRGIPILAVGVGNPDEPKDIRVVNLEVQDIVLVGDQVPFDVVLAADGFDGERIRVDLLLDDEIVATEYAVLEGEGRRQSVRLVWKPTRAGDHTVTAQVESRPGELFTENNSYSKPIKVLDQKIKVLYAEGRPRWEYRYLKNALIRDPTMEAQIFLLGADPDFNQESSPGVPPLRQIPSTREQLFSYHVIVIGDVDAARDLPSDTVSLIKEFVYEVGGGVVFLAGRNANPLSYAHTDLYAILPVEVGEQEVSVGIEAAPISRAFNVELAPVAREHPLMRLDNDPERNSALWENPDGQEQDHLPGFYWFAEVGRPKRGSVVLARHPTKLEPIEQKGRVIHAFMNYGKGRSFFSAVDETWRWRAGVDNQYFYRFWGQVLRFSASGRLLGKTPRFSLATDRPSYSLGATVNIDARVFDANMKPSTEKKLSVFHLARGAESPTPESLELDLDPVQGQGSYRGGLVANRIGLHDLWLGTETERVAFRAFEVVVPALERRDPRKNRSALEEAARVSGGGYYELVDIPRLLQGLEGESRSQEGDVTVDPLWDELWVLLFLTGLLAVEWVLRKVANLT